mgnify:CR=1 FL=1
MTGPLLSTTSLTSPVVNAPVMSRDPNAVLPGELPRGAEIPDDLDPLAAGVLMLHQREWLEDQSDLKICAKGRRTGITFAEALDCTLIAASSRSAGGSNVFYIGDTKDKGREFIGYVAHFAKVVSKELVQIEEFLFEDEREDGSSRFISAYRVTFASGYRVEALSSRPENIRGLQGVVVIDEAAFHKNVREVIDAVNALLIWGGKIRVISSHNGVLNPFNELINEAKAGENAFKVHFIPFQAAVENGLFKRVCLMKGKEYSPEAEKAWEAQIRGAYGTRLSKMAQELDGIPSDAEGAALSRVMIEQATIKGVPVVRLRLPDSFKTLLQAERKRKTQEWLRDHVAPLLKKLDPTRRHDIGLDFARSGDASDLIIQELGQDLVRRWRFVIEMRNVPFETQRDILFFVGEGLPRFGHGAFDATGNGAYLAEVAAQKWGARISEIKLNAGWYGENSPAYIEALSDGSALIAADDDVVRDHMSLQYVNGVVRVPEGMRYKGSDGLDRHGDTAIAGILAWYASRQDGISYGYEPVVRRAANTLSDEPDDDYHDGETDPFRSPLGARLRGGSIH